MESDSTSDRTTKWRSLYEAAIMELDRHKFLERITEAEHAIMDRLEDLNRSNDGSESEALTNALNALRDISQLRSPYR